MSKKMDEKLRTAAYEGDLAALDAALAKGGDPSLEDEDHWRTPAMLACFVKAEGCVRSLRAAGPDLNATDLNGWTAAMFAAASGSVECLLQLIAGKADLSAETRDGATALNLAQERGHPDAALLIEAALSMPEWSALAA